ncbi:thioredoxin domain-containing protein [Halosolutus amylolyticus]|uniref:Thioredoxin domain-containing protein n=1 Tax=Halosolutus amylolyticus TaxID=2932267 RepID=A0ABD5PNH4_9EURY|nr:thioredoxin domain-containing protein [Halosolutus amylolyticus]
MTATGTVSLLGIAGVAAGRSSPIVDAPVPSDPDAYAYPTMGDDDAPTATIYGNYKCPYTQEFVAGNLEAIVEEFVEPGRLALQFHNLAYEPGDTSAYYISSSDPRIAAVDVGVWDEDPDGYWRFHRETVADTPSGTVDYDDLEERLQSAGVANAEAIVDRARVGEYDDEVEQVAAAAAADDVSFTPTLELGGDTTAPHHDRDDILDWIEKRLGDDEQETDSEGDGAGEEDTGGEDGSEDENETDETDGTDETDEGDESSDDGEEQSEDDDFVWVTEPEESNPDEASGTADDC